MLLMVEQLQLSVILVTSLQSRLVCFQFIRWFGNNNNVKVLCVHMLCGSIMCDWSEGADVPKCIEASVGGLFSHVFLVMAGQKSSVSWDDQSPLSWKKTILIESVTWISSLCLGATLVRQSDDFSTQTMSRYQCVTGHLLYWQLATMQQCKSLGFWLNGFWN